MGRIGKVTLAKAKSIYAANKKITKQAMADALGLGYRTVYDCWNEISGRHRSNNTKRKKQARQKTVNEARNLFLQNPDIKPEEIAKELRKTRSYIVELWQDITGHRYSTRTSVSYVSSISENLPIGIQIPEFVPKTKKFVDRDGKECTDVSEFFGIVENGGECYKNVRFTIPKGEGYTNESTSIGRYV